MATPSEAGAEAHGAAQTLPQFDPTWFASQIFWLAITFGLLYWLLSRALLPKVAATIEARDDKIRNDLAAAAAANARAQEAAAAVERGLAGARAEARGLTDAARAEAEAERATQVAAAESRLDKRLAETEARLDAARVQALEAARRAGEDMSALIAERLLGARPAAAGDA